MPVPDYETLMKPLLEAIADGKPYAISEVVEALAKRFDLTAEDLAEKIPSGTQSLFYNRVGWAKTYLQKAGLLSSPKRGVYRITERGKEVLREGPPEIDDDFLMRFEEFRQFLRRSRGSSGKKGDEAIPQTRQTPHELLEAAYLELRSSVVRDIQEAVQALTPQAFEQLVVDLLVKMGYGGLNGEAGEVVGRSGDEGIDGIIRQDPLGLDVIYIQAKQGAGPIGRPEVQKFVGALQGKRARKGVFITSAEFTSEAKGYAENTGVILIDGQTLAEFMFDYGLGVTSVRSYEVKRLDSDYFAELKGDL